MVAKLATCLQGDTPHLAVVLDACTSPGIALAELHRAPCSSSFGTPDRVPGTAPAHSVHVKALADQLFALLPKRLCALRIEGVRLHTATQAGDGDDLGDVAVFAIATANRIGICDASGPN